MSNILYSKFIKQPSESVCVCVCVCIDTKIIDFGNGILQEYIKTVLGECFLIQRLMFVDPIFVSKPKLMRRRGRVSLRKLCVRSCASVGGHVQIFNIPPRRIHCVLRCCCVSPALKKQVLPEFPLTTIYIYISIYKFR